MCIHTAYHHHIITTTYTLYMHHVIMCAPYSQLFQAENLLRVAQGTSDRASCVSLGATDRRIRWTFGDGSPWGVEMS